MYQIETNLQNLSTADYLELAKKSIKRLGWKLTVESPYSITAATPIAWKSNEWGEIITITIENELVIITSKKQGWFPFDGGRNRQHVHNYLEKFSEVSAEPKEGQPLKFVRRKIVQRDGRMKWWQVFVPKKYFFVTPVLLILNIGLFAESLVDGSPFLNPTADELLAWGANAKAVTGGLEQYWRLLTYMFVHAGILQLGFNMFALVVVGLNLEPIIGSVRFAACYIATGLIAGLTSYWWNDNITSAGASGAIFGLYGVYLSLLSTNMIERKMRKVLMGSVILFVVYNIAYGFIKEVDHAAHIGGLVAGLLTGYWIYFLIRSQLLSHVWMQGTAAIAAAIIVMMITIPLVHDPFRDFNKALKEFSVNEESALGFYKLPSDTKDYSAIIFLHDTSIPRWRDCKSELSKLDKLKLPENLIERKKSLHQYVDLHLRLSQRYIDKLGEVTSKYDEEIADMEWSLENLTEQIYGKSKKFGRSQ